jgi:urease accessory protein
MPNELLILQLVDSAFPAGGFVHSGGLESAVQLGQVTHVQSLEEFLRTSLQQVRRGVLVFVARAWRGAADISSVDRDCDLFLNNHIANRASSAQGRAMLSSAAKTFELTPLIDAVELVRSQRLAGHLAPLFGVICRGLEVDLRRTLELFLFMSLRGWISAAVRLGIVGPIQAQQIQARLSVNVPQDFDPLDPATNPAGPVQATPLLDLIASTHDRLYSRLFQS